MSTLTTGALRSTALALVLSVAAFGAVQAQTKPVPPDVQREMSTKTPSMTQDEAKAAAEKKAKEEAEMKAKQKK